MHNSFAAKHSRVSHMVSPTTLSSGRMLAQNQKMPHGRAQRSPRLAMLPKITERALHEIRTGRFGRVQLPSQEEARYWLQQWREGAQPKQKTPYPEDRRQPSKIFLKHPQCLWVRFASATTSWRRISALRTTNGLTQGTPTTRCLANTWRSSEG